MCTSVCVCVCLCVSQLGVHMVMMSEVHVLSSCGKDD